RTLDGFFVYRRHVFSRGFGSPDGPDPRVKRRWLVWHVLRRFASDPLLLSAGLLVSAAIYFTDSWRTVKSPAVEFPLNFFLGIIGVLTIIISVFQIRGLWSYLRRLLYARKKPSAVHLRFHPARPRRARDLPFVTTPASFSAISVSRAWQHVFHSWKGER